MTRKTGTGLMEATGLGTITGDQVSLTIMVIWSIISCSTILGQDSGMTSGISLYKDQSANMTLKVGNSHECLAFT